MISSQNINVSRTTSANSISQNDLDALSSALNQADNLWDMLNDKIITTQRPVLNVDKEAFHIEQNKNSIIQDVENGSVVASSTLSVEDKILIPMGIAIFTKEEREQKIKQITWLNVGKDKKISAGCSVLLNIFADKLRECYQKIQREPIGRHLTAKQFISQWIVGVELMLGTLELGALKTGNFHTSVKIKRDMADFERILMQFLDIYQTNISSSGQLLYAIQGGKNARGIETTVGNLIRNSKACQELVELLTLLKDFAGQEMHRLYMPLELNFDLSAHFFRLNHRAINFTHVLNSVDLIGAPISKETRRYSKLVKESNENYLNFCKLIIEETKKNESLSDQHSLKSFWTSLENYRLDAKRISIKEGLMDKLFLDQKKINNQNNVEYARFQNNVEYARLSTGINHLNWMHDTLLDEVYIVLIERLLKAGSVTNLEIDTCVEKLIDTGNLIINLDMSSIDQRLESLSRDSYLSMELHDIWKEEFKNINRLKLLPVVLHQLKIRLQRCHKDKENCVERIIMLRNALHSFGGKLFELIVTTDSILSNFSKTLGFRNEENAKIAEIYYEIKEFHFIQQSSLTASLESIKALIGRCFTEIDIRTETLKKNDQSNLNMKILSARQAQDELIASVENEQKQKSVKRNQAKKTLKSSPVKKITEKKAAVEIPILEKPYQLTEVIEDLISINNLKPFNFNSDKIEKDTSFKKLNDLKESLFHCKKMAANFKESKSFSTENWQINQVTNLEIFLERLIETVQISNFSVDQIFSQIDLTRKSTEALLDIITIFANTPLDAVLNMGHDTKSKTYFIVRNMNIPEAIRKVLWQLRQTPFLLAEANKSANYPAQGYKDRNNFQFEGQGLINFLIQVDREGHSLQKNDQLRSNFIAEQKYLLNQAVYFLERMLIVMNDPSLLIEEDLPEEFPEILFKNIPAQVEEISVDTAESFMKKSNDQPIDNLITPLSICNRQQALSAIEGALVWMSIRSIAPVEGCLSCENRELERNIALKNCANYLLRLKEKLNPERSNTPMNTVLGQCELIRRIQKELHIAALFHGNHFIDGEPIVKALDIKYENSPLNLMRILQNVSKVRSELPVVGNWMDRAHTTLSYPTPLNGKALYFSSNELQILIKKVHEKSIEMNQVCNDETLITSDGKKKSPEKRCQERVKIVEENEKQKIFPEIALILHILKHCFTIPKHAHLK